MATAVAAPVDAAPGAQLKRLSFVPEVAEKGVHMASAAYATTKAHLPEAVKPKVAQLEERVSSLSAPYVARAQDTSSDLLRAVDSKVREGAGAGPGGWQQGAWGSVGLCRGLAGAARCCIPPRRLPGSALRQLPAYRLTSCSSACARQRLACLHALLHQSCTAPPAPEQPASPTLRPAPLRATALQVDTAVTQAAEMYAANQTYLQQQLEKQKQFHAANLESYRTAREQYLKKVGGVVGALGVCVCGAVGDVGLVGLGA